MATIASLLVISSCRFRLYTLCISYIQIVKLYRYWQVDEFFRLCPLPYILLSVLYGTIILHLLKFVNILSQLLYLVVIVLYQSISFY
nr:MAG TPA: hypothetical protein [Caudoviricetes sp.]